MTDITPTEALRLADAAFDAGELDTDDARSGFVKGYAAALAGRDAQPTPSDDEREALWDLIAGVRDKAPRRPDDAPTDDIVDAILAAFSCRQLPAPSPERRFFASGQEVFEGTPGWDIAPIRNLDGAPFWRDTQPTRTADEGPGQCVVCGKNPAVGFASVWHNGREDWYCHPDEGPSCYAGESGTSREIAPLQTSPRGGWFTSSLGVAIAYVEPVTDRGPALIVDGHVLSPNDAASLAEFFASPDLPTREALDSAIA